MLRINIQGERFEYLEAIETEEYFNGSNRRTLSFICEKNAVEFNKLNSLLSNENAISIIELENTSMEVTNIYEGYVLKLEISIKPFLTQAETPSSKAIYEDRLYFKLGKRTYIEQQLHDLGL